MVGRGRGGIFCALRTGRVLQEEHLPEEPNLSIPGDWQQEGKQL